MFIFQTIQRKTLMEDFTTFQDRLLNFIVKFPPETQECRWLYATSYKTSIKLYQQNNYEETISSLQLAATVHRAMFNGEENGDPVKHLKEVFIFSYDIPDYFPNIWPRLPFNILYCRDAFSSKN